MTYGGNTTLLKNVIIVVTMIGVFVFGILKKYSVSDRLLSYFRQPEDVTNNPSDSQIIAFYTLGHQLTRLVKTTTKGLKYSIFMTLPDESGIAQVAENAVIEVLDLPFDTQTHLIGLSKEHQLDRLKFENFVQLNGMEKVVLEGDFPDYFDIYASQGQQFMSRYVLDPKAMEFVIDFCRTHFWEINSSEFYIVASSQDDRADNIIESSLRFVDAIKPALLPGTLGAAPVHHDVSYGEYDGPPLTCPVCSKKMNMTDSWQTCPDGHGLLVNAKVLADIHSGKLKVDTSKITPMKHDNLTCPKCHLPMEQVDYNGSGVIIDTCTKCAFRWLDASEISKIAR